MEPQTRRNGVTANLTDAELEDLDLMRGGVSRSAFVRNCLMNEIKRQKKKN